MKSLLLILFIFIPVSLLPVTTYAAGSAGTSRSTEKRSATRQSSEAASLTLAEAVSALEKTYGISISLDPAIEADWMVRALPPGLSPEESLRILLSRHDYYLLYCSSDTGKSLNVLKGVWVYPRGSGSGVKMVSNQAQATEPSQKPTPSSAATTPDTGLILKEALTVSPSEGLRVFSDYIRNSDETGWYELCDTALGLGVPVTQQYLEDLFRRAVSEQVRLDIITCIRKHLDLDTPGLQRLATMTLQDPSPAIRAIGAELEKSPGSAPASPPAPLKQ